jgi:lipoate-protein ligase A
MTATLVRNFAVALGTLTPEVLPEDVKAQVAKLARTHTTDEWLLKPGHRSSIRLKTQRRVKIAEGVEVMQQVHKAPGGLIRATVETQQGQILATEISGDFFFYPAEKLAELERGLEGVSLTQANRAVEEFYRHNGIESPGVTPHDLAVALGATESRS